MKVQFPNAHLDKELFFGPQAIECIQKTGGQKEGCGIIETPVVFCDPQI